jgi:shikimate kinase
MMGAGKSSIGERLAAMLDLPFIDLDAEIGRRVGTDPGEVIRGWGIKRFRSLEREMLSLLGSREEFVMATGGGVVEEAENRAFMLGRGRVVYLEVSPRTLALRLKGEASGRPLLDGGDVAGSVEEILRRRQGWYAEAGIVVAAEPGDPATVARRIADLIGGAR